MRNLRCDGISFLDGERVTRAESVRKRNVTNNDNGNNDNKKKKTNEERHRYNERETERYWGRKSLRREKKKLYLWNRAYIRRFQQMSSGALAVVGMTRLPARLECVGLKGRRLCVCVSPCCRQAAGPHTHTPYWHATSLKIARLQCARAAHGVRKWVIRVGDMYIYIFSFSPFSFARFLSRSLAHLYMHTHARTLVRVSHFLSLVLCSDSPTATPSASRRWYCERANDELSALGPTRKARGCIRDNAVNHRG